MSKDTKLIRVPSRGRVITSRGYINTPITKPYRETLQNIFRMLTSKPKPTILEVLPNGRTVELNITNFDKDNTLVKPVIGNGPVVPSVNNAEITPGEDNTPDEAPAEPAQVEVKNDVQVPEDTGATLQESETHEEVPVDVADAEAVINEDNAPDETPTEPAKTENTNNNYQSNRNKNRNKNRNRNNNNDRQQTSETTNTENVEVVPEEVQ